MNFAMQSVYFRKRGGLQRNVGMNTTVTKAIDKRYIKQNLSLPAVVEFCTGERIPRGGFVYCPCHAEKTPSCKIYPDHFYCFGCKRSGDVIQWVIEWEKAAGNEITFQHALELCNELLQGR